MPSTVGLNFKRIINELLNDGKFRLVATELKCPLTPINYFSKLIDSKSYGEEDVKFELSITIRKFSVIVEGKENKKWDFTIY